MPASPQREEDILTGYEKGNIVPNKPPFFLTTMDTMERTMDTVYLRLRMRKNV